MTHEEFMYLYDDALRHGWVTSKIASVAAKQKEREREYNRNYYINHTDKWNKKYTKDIDNHSIARIETRDYKTNKELAKYFESKKDPYSKAKAEEARNKAKEEGDYITRAFGDWNNSLGSRNEQKVRENNRKRIELGQQYAAKEKGAERAMRKMSNKVKSTVNNILNRASSKR